MEDKGPTLLIFKYSSKHLANKKQKKNEYIYISYKKRDWINNELLRNLYKVKFKNMKTSILFFYATLLIRI